MFEAAICALVLVTMHVATLTRSEGARPMAAGIAKQSLQCYKRIDVGMDDGVWLGADAYYPADLRSDRRALWKSP